jgi:telomerase reverse transcriptase
MFMKDFPWCGLLLDTRTLQVKSDYNRLHGVRISDTLTIETSINPWFSLRMKLFHFLKPKTQAALIDTNLNTRFVAALNVYQNFIVCAMKTWSHLKQLCSLHSRWSKAEDFLFGKYTFFPIFYIHSQKDDQA